MAVSGSSFAAEGGAAGRRCVRILVRGRVQGVGFRAWLLGRARRCGLDGRVGNRRDGTVEVVASGEAGRVEDLIADCRHGPPAARVEAIEIDDASPPEKGGFDIAETW
ncbi:MAG: acylphosphatase [Geminicoccaceae bacterium]|nr:acylphosphatase [Geminicoccaceae bacterium]